MFNLCCVDLRKLSIFRFICLLVLALFDADPPVGVSALEFNSVYTLPDDVVF